MAEEADILQELDLELWPQLRDVYKKDWPYYCYLYYCLDMSYQWTRTHGEPIKIYTSGEWKENGTFIMEVEKNHFIMGSVNQSKSELQNAVFKTKIINWNERVKIGILQKDNFNFVFENKSIYILDYFDMASYWWLSQEKAKEFQIKVPDDTYLGTLTKQHTDTVYEYWPHRDHRPKSYIEEILDRNGGWGLFSKIDDSLLSWITRTNYGCLGMLQTDKNHMRKGYASIVAKKCFKDLAEQGIDPVAFIVGGNLVSITFFKKMGFKFISYLSWAGTIPLKNF